MNIGILIPGFGASEDDWALPVYQNLIRELARSHHVRVIALRYPHTAQTYTYHGLTVYPLGYGAWTRGIRRLNLWWDTLQLLRRLHKNQPFDILHGIWADETGALSGWIGKLLNIPSVVTVAGGELVGFREIKYGLQLSHYGRWIVNQALQHNTIIITPGNLTASLIQTKYFSKLTQIPLGIDPDMFYPSAPDRKPDHLIHVASLIPVKNQRLLLDTVALLDNVSLDIIGEGSLEAELKDYARRLGIIDRVKFLGTIPHQQLKNHYSRAQLHMLTSHHEAFGMVTLEAAACGTPTVGTPVGLISDDSSFTRSAGDASDLARLIHGLLSTTTELKKLQKKSLEAVQENYTVEQMATRYIAVYQQAINP